MAKDVRERVSEDVRSEVGSDRLLEGMDGLEVLNRESGKEYRWLNQRADNVSRKQFMQGWKLVGESSPVVAGVKQPDGTRVMGDVVLAERPIELGHKMRARMAARRAKWEGQPAKDFHEAAELANKEARDAGLTGPGVTTFNVNEGGEEEGVMVKAHRKNWRMGAGFDKEGNVTT